MSDQYPIVDDRKTFEQISKGLLPDETIYAVLQTKGGTEYCAVTDYRVIVFDKKFMSRMKAVVSIPFKSIHVVAAADDRGMFLHTSKLAIKTSGEDYELEFFDPKRAHQAHNLILHFIVKGAPK